MTTKRNFLSSMLTKVGYKVLDIQSYGGTVEATVMNGAKEVAPVYCFADRTADGGMTVKFKIANGALPTETIRNTRSLDERATIAVNEMDNGLWNNCTVDTYNTRGNQPQGTLQYNSTVLRMRFDAKPW